VDAATDAEIAAWLSADGKLVKRPVLVAGERVIVGFKPAAYEALVSNR
jgi:arsenate reductase